MWFVRVSFIRLHALLLFIYITPLCTHIRRSQALPILIVDLHVSRSPECHIRPERYQRAPASSNLLPRLVQVVRNIDSSSVCLVFASHSPQALVIVEPLL